MFSETALNESRQQNKANTIFLKIIIQKYILLMLNHPTRLGETNSPDRVYDSVRMTGKFVNGFDGVIMKVFLQR